MLQVLVIWVLFLQRHVHGVGAPGLYAYFETPLKDDVGVSDVVVTLSFFHSDDDDDDFFRSGIRMGIPD